MLPHFLSRLRSIEGFGFISSLGSVFTFFFREGVRGRERISRADFSIFWVRSRFQMMRVIMEFGSEIEGDDEVDDPI